MNITYRTEGDYLIPNIFANEEPEQTLTKYGMFYWIGKLAGSMTVTYRK